MDSSSGTTPVPNGIRNPYMNPPRRDMDAAPMPQQGSTVADEAQPDRNVAPEKEESSNLVEEKKDDENAGTKIPPSATGTSSSFGDPSKPNQGLAYWERLPSRNLSLGSAEILTVDECVRHSALYQGRAVRVTGQLHQRTFVGGGDTATPRQVLLELIDPCSIAQQPRATPVKPSTTPSTPVTPGTIENSYKTPLKTLGPRRSSGNPSLLGNLSSQTPGSALTSNKRKRPLVHVSARKKTPPKSEPRLLLKVIADPELPRLATIAPCGASKVMVMGVLLENGWVQARFVSLVDPSTDMALYVDSLQARRTYLYRRYKELTEAGTLQPAKSESPETPVLILGCGPPPYDCLEEQDAT